MIIYCYKTRLLHDHKCDACSLIFVDMCTKNCYQKDELCPDCKEEYERWLKNNGY